MIVARLGVVLAGVCVAATVSVQAHAQAPAAPPDPARTDSLATRTKTTFIVLAGGVVGLALHESGHVVTAMALGARPSVDGIRYGPIPFFTIRHATVSRRGEFVITSAGFWVQHATSEWLLTTRPNLRSERAPFAKGVFAFNLATAAVYSVAAFGRFGPPERDTLGMATSLGRDGIGEPWVGALVLAPAALDGYRYLRPDSRWAKWTSRGIKLAGVALVAAAGR